MQITLLNSKIHRATVTRSELHYEGSCAIDINLLETAGIKEFQQLQIYNVTNGERFTTYAMRAEEGSGIISVNGAAAHLAKKGHKLIICTYGIYDSVEAYAHLPTLVYVDDDNKIIRTAIDLPIQQSEPDYSHVKWD